jgi:hypothetical protein
VHISSRKFSGKHAYDEALGIFADEAMLHSWQHQLALMVEDDRVAPPVAGLSTTVAFISEGLIRA